MESLTFLVDLDGVEARRLTRPKADYMEVIEAFDQWKRMTGHRPDYVDGGVELVAVKPDDWAHGKRSGRLGDSVLDVAAARPGYLWSARHFIGQARYELSSGRYREGHCPDLDRLNGALARLEDELRLMALADDPRTAAFAKAERETP